MWAPLRERPPLGNVAESGDDGAPQDPVVGAMLALQDDDEDVGGEIVLFEAPIGGGPMDAGGAGPEVDGAGGAGADDGDNVDALVATWAKARGHNFMPEPLFRAISIAEGLDVASTTDFDQEAATILNDIVRAAGHKLCSDTVMSEVGRESREVETDPHALCLGRGPRREG